LAGEKFGKLTVLSYADGGKWMCQCECRNKPAHAIMTTNLTSGNTTSCGCARVKHRLSNTAEYKREKTKRWYRNNPDRAAESAKKWRKKNSEKVKRLRKGWIANNRVKQMLLQARKRAKERGIPFCLWKPTYRSQRNVLCLAYRSLSAARSVETTGLRWIESITIMAMFQATLELSATAQIGSNQTPTTMRWSLWARTRKPETGMEL
jgi:hypothetical protein